LLLEIVLLLYILLLDPLVAEEAEAELGTDRLTLELEVAEDKVEVLVVMLC
jgi:hypothetical protein